MDKDTPGSVLLPYPCNFCGKNMRVLIEETAGFGQGNFFDHECPHCHKTGEYQLPNRPLDSGK